MNRTMMLHMIVPGQDDKDYHLKCWRLQSKSGKAAMKDAMAKVMRG